ncbi:unnamed protein product [Calicophoron daubneyi]|uniref:Ubiquitin-like domain-containing protein n=1 Tax=Calicophoron daubneyi TaxID=300641 RepID=A0AAV2TMQ1_CALDB
MTSDDLELNIVFVSSGGRSSKLKVTSGTEKTVLDLMKVIHKALRIPSDKQRLIFRGKSLLDPDALLSNYGLKNGSKIMVLGSIEELDPDEMAKLNKAKSDLETLTNELDRLYEQQAISASTTKTETAKQLKATLDVAEKGMRTLELLDSVRLPYDSESERQLRKNLVDLFQDLLLRADELKRKLMQSGPSD